jgi:hypothetical protein
MTTSSASGSGRWCESQRPPQNGAAGYRRFGGGALRPVVVSRLGPGYPVGTTPPRTASSASRIGVDSGGAAGGVER